MDRGDGVEDLADLTEVMSEEGGPVPVSRDDATRPEEYARDQGGEPHGDRGGAPDDEQSAA